MWQGSSSWKRLRWLHHGDPVTSVYAVGNRVITGSEDRTACVWDLHTGRHLHTLFHGDTVKSVYAVDNRVITGSRDGTAGVWDLQTGRRLHTLRHGRHVDTVYAVDNRVITGSEDRTAGVWGDPLRKMRVALQLGASLEAARLRAAERTYAPEGAGTAEAQDAFYTTARELDSFKRKR